MNSSVVSIYDNVSAPDSLLKSRVYKKLNDLLYTEPEIRIFCPLCINSFTFKFSLFEHLRTFHFHFLSQANSQTLRFKECPFCNAKFYGKYLTTKHVLHHHPKVIRGLFVNQERFNCSFCNVKIINGNLEKHIEELHFLDFEKEFRKLFSCETDVMAMSELMNSAKGNKNGNSTNWKDVYLTVRENSENDSNVKNFDEASRINCFDFTELKEQLENIKETQSKISESKSVLKNLRNRRDVHKSARRVLRFDIPSDSENKENCEVVEIQNNEQGPLNDKKKLRDSFFEKPQHCSTPNTKFKGKKNKSKNIYQKLASKSHITENEVTEFNFQCGKCRLLFKKNSDLVHHLKSNHKKFSLSAFQPCYHCAICNAKFFRNCYLRKHHNIHKSY